MCLHTISKDAPFNRSTFPLDRYRLSPLLLLRSAYSAPHSAYSAFHSGGSYSAPFRAFRAIPRHSAPRLIPRRASDSERHNINIYYTSKLR